MREGIIDKPAEKEFLPMQPGDVYQTYADVDELIRDFNFKPNTSLRKVFHVLPDGIRNIMDCNQEVLV